MFVVIRKQATFGPSVRAHGPQSQFRFGSLMHPCGKLLDICLTPSTLQWWPDTTKCRRRIRAHITKRKLYTYKQDQTGSRVLH